MAMTKKQAEVFRIGTVAAIKRNQELDHVLLDMPVLPHTPAALVKEAVEAAQDVLKRGGLNPAQHRIQEVHIESVNILLSQLTEKDREIAMLRVQLAQGVQISSAVPASEPVKWMSVREAADELGIHIQKVYRAIEDHRISTKSRRVTSKRNHLVDPKTFIPKERSSKKK